MVGVAGLEPATLNPQSSDSTTELHPDGFSKRLRRRTNLRLIREQTLPAYPIDVQTSLPPDSAKGPFASHATRSRKADWLIS